MDKELRRYVGQVVEIIYQGRDGQISQRHIEIHEIRGSNVRAYCLQRQAPRVFRIENILALVPVARRFG